MGGLFVCGALLADLFQQPELTTLLAPLDLT